MPPTFEDIYLQLLGERAWADVNRDLRQTGRVPSGDTATPETLQPLIQATAKRYDMDPTLVAAVMQIESGFNARAVSPKGAQGLMQLMPATAADYGVRDAFDPEENIDGGVRFLRDLNRKYKGDVQKVLAAYNAGPGTVDRYGGIPPYPETQQYVQKVLAQQQSGVIPGTAVQTFQGPGQAPSAERTTPQPFQVAPEIGRFLGGQGPQGQPVQPLIPPAPTIVGTLPSGRPIIQNADGTVSTHRNIIVNIDGKEALVPTIFGGRQVSEDEAIQIVQQHRMRDPDTGEAIRTFDTVEEAEAFEAQQHEELESLSQQGQHRRVVPDLKPAQLSAVRPGESPGGTPFVDVGFADPGRAVRSAQDFGRGFVGAIGSLARTPGNILRIVGLEETPTDVRATAESSPVVAITNTLRDAGQLAQQLVQQWDSPGARQAADFWDRLLEGAGTLTAYLVPAFLTGGGAAGVVTMTGLEGVAEANQTFEELEPLVGRQEAATRAAKTLAANVVLLGITNSLGIMGEAATPLRKILSGVLGEGVQEVAQYDIQRRQFWVPAEHPQAQQLVAQGWQQHGDRLIQPFEIGTAAEAGLIGAVLGGGAAFVDALVLGTSGMREAIQARIQAEDPDFTFEEAIAAARQPLTPQTQSWFTYLRNERGSLDLFGQQSPEEGQPPAQPQQSPTIPDAGTQAPPEQLGLAGIPQQTTFTLPPNLQRAQVNMGQVPLQFADDLDKAMYIVGNPKTQSQRHAAYLDALTDFLQVPAPEAMRLAEERRQQILAYGRQYGRAGETLQVPAGALPQTETITGSGTTTQAQPAAPVTPEGQIEMTPLLGTETGDMQGLPLINTETMQGLRDFLRMVDAERAETLQIQGKPLEVNYDFIQTDDGVKQVLSAISEVYLDDVATIRTPKSQEETREAAKKLNLTVEQFLTLDREQLVSRRKAILGREMAVASARQLKVATAMFRSGNMPGRDLLRTFAVHSAIQLQFARLANEAGGALQIFTAPVEGDLTSLRGFEKIMEYLGSQRISDEKLAALIENTPTPEQLQRVMEQAPRAMAKDVLLNLWYGVWLLSNPKTFIVNFISTALAIPTGILERGIAAHIPGREIPLETAMQRSLVAQQPHLTREQRVALRADRSALYQRDVESGEATAMMYALWRTVGDAWRLAKQAFQTGESQFSQERTAEGLEQTVGGGYHRVSEDIRGIRHVGTLPVGTLTQAATFGPLAYFWDALGAVAQTSSGGLMAADEFFKALNYQMSKYAMAYRVGVQQGLAEGKSVNQVLDEQRAWLARTPPDAEEVILREMGERTFTRPLTDYEGGLLSGLGGGIQRAAQEAPILRVWVPFVRTGTNITYYNLERAPLVSLAVREVRRDIAAGGARRDLALARMAMGGLTAIGIGMLGHLGLALIRGDEGRKPAKAAEEQVLGQQRYSWRIPFGNTYLSVSFQRLDPLSQFIGFMTDWASKAEDVYASNQVQEWLEIGAAGMWALTKNITNRNYMQGLQDFMELVQNDEDQDPEVTLGRWQRFINNQSARLVPAGVGAIEQAFDPGMTEVSTWWEAFTSRLPFTDKVPRLDFWANPVQGPHLTPLIDLVNPFPVQLERRDVVTEELITQGANLSGPSRYLLLPQRPQEGQEDEAVALKPDEWNRLKTIFAKEIKDGSGRDLRAHLEDVMISPDYQVQQGGPNSGKTQRLNQAIAIYKDLAKLRFIQEGMDAKSLQHETLVRFGLARAGRTSRQLPPAQAQEFLQRELSRIGVQ